MLGVILLADGAPELWKLLTGNLNAETLGVPVRQLVDLWHLLEKLGSAARLLYGEAQGSTVLQGWRLRLLNRTSSVAEILQELHLRVKRRWRSARVAPYTRPSPIWRIIRPG